MNSENKDGPLVFQRLSLAELKAAEQSKVEEKCFVDLSEDRIFSQARNDFLQSFSKLFSESNDAAFESLFESIPLEELERVKNSGGKCDVSFLSTSKGDERFVILVWTHSRYTTMFYLAKIEHDKSNDFKINDVSVIESARALEGHWAHPFFCSIDSQNALCFLSNDGDSSNLMVFHCHRSLIDGKFSIEGSHMLATSGFCSKPELVTDYNYEEFPSDGLWSSPVIHSTGDVFFCIFPEQRKTVELWCFEIGLKWRRCFIMPAEKLSNFATTNLELINAKPSIFVSHCRRLFLHDFSESPSPEDCYHIPFIKPEKKKKKKEKPEKKLIPTIDQLEVMQSLSSWEYAIIHGAARTGKTTVLKQIVALFVHGDQDCWIYANSEDFETWKQFCESFNSDSVKKCRLLLSHMDAIIFSDQKSNQRIADCEELAECNSSFLVVDGLPESSDRTWLNQRRCKTLISIGGKINIGLQHPKRKYSWFHLKYQFMENTRSTSDSSFTVAGHVPFSSMIRSKRSFPIESDVVYEYSESRAWVDNIAWKFFFPSSADIEAITTTTVIPFLERRVTFDIELLSQYPNYLDKFLQIFIDTNPPGYIFRNVKYQAPKFLIQELQRLNINLELDIIFCSKKYGIVLFTFEDDLECQRQERVKLKKIMATEHKDLEIQIIIFTRDMLEDETKLKNNIYAMLKPIEQPIDYSTLVKFFYRIKARSEFTGDYTLNSLAIAHWYESSLSKQNQHTSDFHRNTFKWFKHSRILLSPEQIDVIESPAQFLVITGKRQSGKTQIIREMVIKKLKLQEREKVVVIVPEHMVRYTQRFYQQHLEGSAVPLVTSRYRVSLHDAVFCDGIILTGEAEKFLTERSYGSSSSTVVALSETKTEYSNADDEKSDSGFNKTPDELCKIWEENHLKNSNLSAVYFQLVNISEKSEDHVFSHTNITSRISRPLITLNDPPCIREIDKTEMLEELFKKIVNSMKYWYKFYYDDIAIITREEQLAEEIKVFLASKSIPTGSTEEQLIDPPQIAVASLEHLAPTTTYCWALIILIRDSHANKSTFESAEKCVLLEKFTISVRSFGCSNMMSGIKTSHCICSVLDGKSAKLIGYDEEKQRVIAIKMEPELPEFEWKEYPVYGMAKKSKWLQMECLRLWSKESKIEYGSPTHLVVWTFNPENGRHAVLTLALHSTELIILSEKAVFEGVTNISSINFLSTSTYLLTDCNKIYLMLRTADFRLIIESITLKGFHLHEPAITFDGSDRSAITIEGVIPGITLHGEKPTITLLGGKPAITVEGGMPRMALEGGKPGITMENEGVQITIEGGKSGIITIEGGKPGITMEVGKPRITVEGEKPVVTIQGGRKPALTIEGGNQATRIEDGKPVIFIEGGKPAIALGGGKPAIKLVEGKLAITSEGGKPAMKIFGAKIAITIEGRTPTIFTSIYNEVMFDSTIQICPFLNSGKLSLLAYEKSASTNILAMASFIETSRTFEVKIIKISRENNQKEPEFLNSTLVLIGYQAEKALFCSASNSKRMIVFSMTENEMNWKLLFDFTMPSIIFDKLTICENSIVVNGQCSEKTCSQWHLCSISFQESTYSSLSAVPYTVLDTFLFNLYKEWKQLFQSALETKIMAFSEEQKSALHCNAPVQIIAGPPGTGKTTIIMAQAFRRAQTQKSYVLANNLSLLALMQNLLRSDIYASYQKKPILVLKNLQPIEDNADVYVDEFAFDHETEAFLLRRWHCAGRTVVAMSNLQTPLGMTNFFWRFHLSNRLDKISRSHQYDGGLESKPESAQVLTSNYEITLLTTVYRGNPPIVKKWRRYFGEISVARTGPEVYEVETFKYQACPLLIQKIITSLACFKFFARGEEAAGNREKDRRHLAVITDDDKYVPILRRIFDHFSIPNGSAAEQLTNDSIIAVDYYANCLSYEWPAVIVVALGPTVGIKDSFYLLSRSRAIASLEIFERDFRTVQSEIDKNLLKYPEKTNMSFLQFKSCIYPDIDDSDATEIVAFRRKLAADRTFDPDTAAAMIRHNYIPNELKELDLFKRQKTFLGGLAAIGCSPSAIQLLLNNDRPRKLLLRFEKQELRISEKPTKLLNELWNNYNEEKQSAMWLLLQRSLHYMEKEVRRTVKERKRAPIAEKDRHMQKKLKSSLAWEGVCDSIHILLTSVLVGPEMPDMPGE